MRFWKKTSYRETPPMSLFWNTGQHASETDCDRPNLYKSSVVFLSIIQIVELLSKFNFVLHIYHAALPKLLLRFKLNRSAPPPPRYKKIRHTSKQKLQVKRFELTADILLSSAAYSDNPLSVTLPTQTVHFPSPYLLRQSTSCHRTYSDSPFPIALPTQTVHFVTLPT
jgi:hypothetical protein